MLFDNTNTYATNDGGEYSLLKISSQKSSQTGFEKLTSHIPKAEGPGVTNSYPLFALLKFETKAMIAMSTIKHTNEKPSWTYLKVKNLSGTEMI
jgi:hypothetical protein